MRTPSIPLGRKRKLRRTRLLVGSGCALIALLVAGLIVVWQPALRVSTVTVDGTDASAIETATKADLAGTRYLIVPKNSIFFIPERELRASLLAHFPEAEAVSIRPQGLMTLSIHVTPRATVLWWCGTTVSDMPTCYQADASGLIFASVPYDESTATSSYLLLYAPLAKDVGDASPLGSTVANASVLPGLIEFVKAMRSLGANVVSVVIRSDEADLYTSANTRITYVMGREKQAAGLAASAFPTLNLNDGSLLYVDLRFDNKVFFKKK